MSRHTEADYRKLMMTNKQLQQELQIADALVARYDDENRKLKERQSKADK